jgi:hypothetical protein
MGVIAMTNPTLTFTEIDIENFKPDNCDGELIKFRGSVFTVREFTAWDRVKIKCTNKDSTGKACNGYSKHYFSNAYNKRVDIDELGRKVLSKPRLPTDPLIICEKCKKEIKAWKLVKGKTKLKSFLIREVPTNGLEIVIVPVGKIPDQKTRKIYTFISRYATEEKDIQQEEVERLTIKELLETYGTYIEIKGHFFLDPEFTKNGKVIKTDYRCRAHEISAIKLISGNPTEEELKEMREYMGDLSFDRISIIIAPEIKGRELLKTEIILTLATPLSITEFNSKDKMDGRGKAIIIGDPGVAKSDTVKYAFDQIDKTNPQFVSAERVSIPGLTALVKKLPSGEYELTPGAFPYAHRGAICIEGMHQLDKEKLAKLREVIDKGQVQISMAAFGTLPAKTRVIGISNCMKDPLDEYYPTAYDATHDIGVGAQWEERDKLSGADRRRWWLFYVAKKYTEEEIRGIINHQVKFLKPDSIARKDDLLCKLLSYIHSRKHSDYNWDEISKLEFIKRITDILDVWRSEYYDIDLALFGVQGFQIFLSYIIASASLKLKLKNGKITPDEEDVEYVKMVFEAMFENLELDKYVGMKRTEESIAEQIKDQIPQDVVEIIIKRVENPTITAKELGEMLNVTAETLSNRIKRAPNILLAIPGTLGVEYSIYEGSTSMKIEPIFDRWGLNLTDLGKKVYEKLK